MITDNEVLKEILKDSYGGVIYDLANKDKYDTKELLEEWHTLTESEKDSLGGIVNGAMNFIQGK